MKHSAIAGFAAGAAMMIGGAFGAVSNLDPKSAQDTDIAVTNAMIGGQAMLPDRGIMENISASPMHTVFVKDLKDSGVAAALKPNGQFTVFAPTNAAFAAAGHQSKAGLARSMRYMIVPGTYDSRALLRMITEQGGRISLRTLEGGALMAQMNGPRNVALVDERGHTARITITDVRGNNGVIHVVDRVLQPGSGARELASN